MAVLWTPGIVLEMNTARQLGPERSGIKMPVSEQHGGPRQDLGSLGTNKRAPDNLNFYLNSSSKNDDNNNKQCQSCKRSDNCGVDEDMVDGASCCVTGIPHTYMDHLVKNPASAQTSQQHKQDWIIPHTREEESTNNNEEEDIIYEVLRDHQDELAEELDANSTMTALAQAGILSEEDQLLVSSRRARKSKAETIITLVLEKGTETCGKLKDILQKCNPQIYQDIVSWEKCNVSGAMTEVHSKAIEIMRNLFLEEMDVSHMIKELEFYNIISDQDLIKLGALRKRKDKADYVISIVLQKGEVAYKKFKISLDPSLRKSLQAWEYTAQESLLRDQHENASEPPHKRLIRKKWKTLVDELQPDIGTFSRLYQKRVINEEEERYMAQETSKHDANRRLLLRLDSKDDTAFQNFISAVQESQEPLGYQLQRWLDDYKDREKQIKTENNRGTFMSRGQKAALLLSYWELRDHVDVKDWADELIQEGVLEPQNREVLDRTFSREGRLAYVLYLLTQHKDTRTFNVMVEILNRDWPNIAQMVKDAAEQERRRRELYVKYCDTIGVMEMHIKEVYVHPASGSPVIQTIHFHEYMKKTIMDLLTPYADVVQVREGSITVVLNFRSLVELTKFWLDCLDGSLQEKMGEAVATDAIRAGHSPDSSYTAAIDMTLDRYITLAYQLLARKTCEETQLNEAISRKKESGVITKPSSAHNSAMLTPRVPQLILTEACTTIIAANKESSFRIMSPTFAPLTGRLPEGVLKMMEEYQLSQRRCEGISHLLEQEMDKGLTKSHQQAYVQMLPTCVHDLPDGNPAGQDKMLALHFGGSHLRVHLISLKEDGADIKGRDFTISSEARTGIGMQLFDYMAECLANFLQAQNVEQQIIPLRFILSYPFSQQHLANGNLVRWTKGVQCGHVGEDFVKLLQEAIDRREDIQHVKCEAILNDTVSTLMATAALDNDCAVAVIIGTGTNACYVEKLEAVEKWQGDEAQLPTQVVVNTEWGAFGEDGCLDDVRTEVDLILDKNSINRGQQIYEKMISGMYIAEITRLLLMKSVKEGYVFRNVSPSNLQALMVKDALHAENMSQIERDTADGNFRNVEAVLTNLGIVGYTEEDCASLWYISSLVSRRAAYLAAAGVATILNRMQKANMTVAVEGSLYRYHPHFHRLLEQKVKELVDPSLKFKLLVPSENESQCGPALLKVDRYRLFPTEPASTGAHGRCGTC